MRAAITAATLAAGLLAQLPSPVPPHAVPPRQDRPDPSTLVDRTVRIPAADLTIWDPINPNVNPIPWRVSGPAGPDGVRPSAFRHQAVGARVRAEGIAWGYNVDTELPRSRLVFEGGVVLIKGADFNQPGIRGKLVRVEGTLRREFIPGHPGYQREFPEFYFIDATSFEVIDAVTAPEIVRLQP